MYGTETTVVRAEIMTTLISLQTAYVAAAVAETLVKTPPTALQILQVMIVLGTQAAKNPVEVMTTMTSTPWGCVASAPVSTNKAGTIMMIRIRQLTILRMDSCLPSTSLSSHSSSSSLDSS